MPLPVLQPLVPSAKALLSTLLDLSAALAWLRPLLQVSPNDVLSYQLAAAGLQLPLAPMLPDTSAVLQAAALQQQLALAQRQVRAP